MPTDTFSTGRDITITFVTPEVGPLTLDLVTSFNAKQISSEESPMGLDGIVRHVRFFKGWNGSFSFDRRSSVIDDYFALLEQNYWDGQSETGASMTTTIQETNGSVTQWRYTNVLAKYDDAGDYKGDATVKQTMSFLASKRLKIA